MTNQQVCRAVSSRVLVPGDVVVLLPGTTTCDMVLLQGNCLVEESSLSGEVGFSTTALFLQHVMSLTQRSACLLCFAETLFSSTWNGFSHQPLVLCLLLLAVCCSSCALHIAKCRQMLGWNWQPAACVVCTAMLVMLQVVPGLCNTKSQ